jgi:HD-GYP domain-containing protein (c-di-GMP phosphodiesterase class II)
VNNAWIWAWSVVYEYCRRAKLDQEGKLGCADCRHCITKLSDDGLLHYQCNERSSHNWRKEVPPYHVSPRLFGKSDVSAKLKKYYPREWEEFEKLRECRCFILSRNTRWEELIEETSSISALGSPRRSEIPSEVLELQLREADEFLKLACKEGWFHQINTKTHQLNLEEQVFEIISEFVQIGMQPEISDIMHQLTNVWPHLNTELISHAWARIDWFLRRKENLLRLRSAIMYEIALRLHIYPTFAYDWQTQNWAIPKSWRLEQGLLLEDLMRECMNALIQRERRITKANSKETRLLDVRYEDLDQNSRRIVIDTVVNILKPIEKACEKQHCELPFHRESDDTSSKWPTTWQNLLKLMQKDPNQFMLIHKNFSFIKLKLRTKKARFETHRGRTPTLSKDQIIEYINIWGQFGETELNKRYPLPSGSQTTSSEILVSELALNNAQKPNLLLFKGFLVDMWLQAWPKHNTWSNLPTLPLWGRVLLSMMDTHDLYTRNHSEKTAFLLSQFIEQILSYFSSNGDQTLEDCLPNILGDGEKLSQFLHPKFPEALILAGLFHDMGKLFVSSSILHKPGKLDPEEWWWIYRHVVDGSYFLERIFGIEQARISEYFGDYMDFAKKIICDAAYYHHEKWNGNGYRKGLRGKQIPLVARFVRIADCLGAMMSPRPYRSTSLSIKDVTMELDDTQNRKINMKDVAKEMVSPCLTNTDDQDPILLLYWFLNSQVETTEESQS